MAAAFARAAIAGARLLFLHRLGGEEVLELFRRLPDIEATAEPERLRSNFIRGIKRLPVEVVRA